MDVPADMEEVRKRLQAVAAGSPRAAPVILSPAIRPSPMPMVSTSSLPILGLSTRDPQDMMAEVGWLNSFQLLLLCIGREKDEGGSAGGS